MSVLSAQARTPPGFQVRQQPDALSDAQVERLWKIAARRHLGDRRRIKVQGPRDPFEGNQDNLDSVSGSWRIHRRRASLEPAKRWRRRSRRRRDRCASAAASVTSVKTNRTPEVDATTNPKHNSSWRADYADRADRAAFAVRCPTKKMDRRAFASVHQVERLRFAARQDARDGNRSSDGSRFAFGFRIADTIASSFSRPASFSSNMSYRS